MTKKEDFEYVLLEDLPLMKAHINSISRDFEVAIDNAMKHVDVLEDKHDAITLAKEQTNELQKLVKRLDSFFIRELAKQEERPLAVPKEAFVTKREKEFATRSQQSLKSIQHNLEELKKHLNLL